MKTIILKSGVKLTTNREIEFISFGIPGIYFFDVKGEWRSFNFDQIKEIL